MIWRSLFFSLCMLTLSGCNLDKPIKIGFIGSLSGKNAADGVAARDGVQLAVETTNSSGGIDGRMLLLKIADDASVQETAAKAVEEMAADKVVAIVGPMGSALVKAALPAVRRNKIVLVSPTLGNTVPVNVQLARQNYANFRQAFAKRFNYQPTPAAVLAYDAAQAVITGLRKNQSTVKFRETMQGVKSFPGLQGEIVLEQYGGLEGQLYIIRTAGGPEGGAE